MKLLTKISLNFLSISLFIFLVGVILFYYFLRQQVDQNINAELQKRQVYILNQLESAHSSEKLTNGIDDKVNIAPLDEGQISTGYSDTIVFNEDSNRHQAYRQLTFEAEINGRNFQVQIYKSLTETDNLIVRILLLTTAMVVALIGGLLILNRHTSRVAWRAFYDTINKISNYDLNSHEDFTLSESDIKEFDDLNKVLLSMTERIKKDYYNLKEYTENASHELQTPLAVIISKLEVLLQSENLKEKELKTVIDAIDASSKLSRLNSTLLLLAKIENRQFPETKQVDLSETINEQLRNLAEVIENKKLVVKPPAGRQLIKMNPYLADILISNLIKNAIRHNETNGLLNFELTDKKLVISNSGKEIPGDKKKLFQRFYKSSSSTKSTGLGLSIVQKICEVSGFNAQYEYKNKLHNFIIVFSDRKFL